MKEVTILGGGLVGITSAYLLAQARFKVTVIDSQSAPAMKTSFANGAQLSYSKTSPLANPQTIRHLPYYLFSPSTPLHINTLSPEFISWGIKFLYESLPKKYAKNNTRIIDLSLRSRLAFHQICNETNIEFNYEQLGKMYLYNTKEAVEAAAGWVKEQNRYGFRMQILTPDEAVSKEPSLLHMRDDIAGAAFCPVDESGDAKKFCDELTKYCEEHLGVRFMWNTKIEKIIHHNGKVTGIKTENDTIPIEIGLCCLGIESNSVLESLNIKLPIYPMKGYSITVPSTRFSPKISITDESRKVVYSKLGDRLRIAGVAEFSGYGLELNRKRLDKMLKDAKECFPDAGDYTAVSEWAGLRPLTSSCVPITKQSDEYSNFFLNTGHGMLGWTLCAGSAEAITAIIKSSS